MADNFLFSSTTPIREAINQAYCCSETAMIRQLLEYAELSDYHTHKAATIGSDLVKKARAARRKKTGIDTLLTEYALSSDEGIALMCLAEALLRVPDKATVDSLIKDKLTNADWKSHLDHSDSFFINATTWALMLTGKILTHEPSQSRLHHAIWSFVNRSSESVIRLAVNQAMRLMSRQFVMGETIEDAILRAKKKEAVGYRYSYDMLGEAAITTHDAKAYFDAYIKAIEAVGASSDQSRPLESRGSVSVKLSALHPRYHEADRDTVVPVLSASLLALAKAAKRCDISLTVDAEESERLELSLDIFERVFCDPALSGWGGLGLAVQSYQKRAFFVLDWIYTLAQSQNTRIMVRLIKGAYWDSEIKKAQVSGHSDYPVFTRKVNTDVSFLACAKKMLTMTDLIYSQFATHNAYSVAAILAMADTRRDFEFQCLHGMGNELYSQIVPVETLGIPCRIYAPVGTHEHLLPYLVRRLLENGANSSFVNRLLDENVSVSELVRSPFEAARAYLTQINENTVHETSQKVPNPSAVFMPVRLNSRGFNFNDRAQVCALQERMRGDFIGPGSTLPILAPIEDATPADIDAALVRAEGAFEDWARLPVDDRAQCLERYAQLLEAHREELWALLCSEAGKTWYDCVDEVRESIDFCRYYANQARALMLDPQILRGYTGEYNALSLYPRGVALCISPWNFPLAILTGQIVAALVTGNCVIAKPAEQTPLIAGLAVRLMHEAGIPSDVVQLLLGSGEIVGARLTTSQSIKVVLFTGSTETANRINLTLAQRGGEIIPFIAETGGINAMIVDSSALLEQVVMDVIQSAFGSAGQRCSALRVLYLQEDIYQRTIALLQGAMAELKTGDPRFLSTDVGPVIDGEALEKLQAHVARMRESHDIIYQCALPDDCPDGYFMPPVAIRINSIKALSEEVFGPVLHVIQYARQDLDKVIDEINNTGFGLTLGVQSRITETAETIRARVRAGNCYVNRTMTGAVVGLQPFGGQGLSGTGPKAGGPYYLQRLCVEKTYTVDTTAAGGNASLMSLPEG